MSWVGPEKVVAALTENILAGVPTLLVGPVGVGAGTLAAHGAAAACERRSGRVLPLVLGSGGGADRLQKMMELLGHRSALMQVVLASVGPGVDSRVANRVLKILEESPEGVSFVLWGRGAERLPTIASRCVKLAVPSLPSALVASVLCRDDPTLDHGDAWWAGRASGGRAGLAKELLSAREYVLRARSLVKAAVAGDKPAWLADLAALTTDPVEAAAVALLLRVWAAEVVSHGGSALLGDTDGAERAEGLAIRLLEALSRPGISDALSVRRGMFETVYSS